MAVVLVPLAEGFEEIEALSVVDVLRRGGVQVVMASLNDELPVNGAHGIRVYADALLTDVVDDAYDAIVLPGGGQGMENLRASEEVLERLRRQKEEGLLMCAICAAPLVLEAAGVLDEEQHVTCYPTCQMEMNRPWHNEPVVEHGNVITGQGPGTSLLFALVVLKALTGEATAKRVSRLMVTDCL